MRALAAFGWCSCGRGFGGTALGWVSLWCLVNRGAFDPVGEGRVVGCRASATTPSHAHVLACARDLVTLLDVDE